MPFSKIKEAVLSCDENVLSEQHLRQMESFAPDDKEVQCRKDVSFIAIKLCLVHK